MRIAAIVLFGLAAIVGIIAWSVWRADTVAVAAPPSAVQQGQQQLHAQLQETIQHESEIEKQAWNSMDAMVKLLRWHQQRIERLTGNPQATEVVRYDRESVTRLQARINQLDEEQKVRDLAAAEKAKEDAIKAKQDALQQKAERAAATLKAVN
jgi:Trk K+ transport system NAD-binding subunit